MRTILAVTVVLAVATTTITACSPHAVIPRRDYGTATGTLLFGGPGLGRGPVPGTVTAVDNAGSQSQVTAGNNGHFKISLPAGVYKFEGSSPKVTLNGSAVQCGALHSVIVKAHQVTRGVKVFCTLV